MFCIHSRKEYAMKTVLFLVLAVAFMAAVLTPVAIARATSWKWNADRIQRTLPNGTAAVLKILYSQGVYPNEVRKGLKGCDHFFSATVYNNWNIQYWYWWK